MRHKTEVNNNEQIKHNQNMEKVHYKTRPNKFIWIKYNVQWVAKIRLQPRQIY